MRRRGLRAVSAQRAAEAGRRAEVRRLALQRDRGCLAAGVVTGVACAGPLDADEWELRSAGGSHLDLDNVQTLCRAHHDWKHAHPIEAAHCGLRPYPAGYMGPRSPEKRLGAPLRADRGPSGD